MLYFAYGSNISIRRFKQRVTTAKLIGRYTLWEHQLKFHKIGQDYSGKCDAYFTGNKQDKVLGLVFNFAHQEKSQLDKLEDLGIGYQEKKVRLVNQIGSTLEAYTYYAIKIKSDLKPFSWYKQHIIYGAKKANFPDDYLNYIINYPEIIDKDVERQRRELSIYS